MQGLKLEDKNKQKDFEDIFWEINNGLWEEDTVIKREIDKALIDCSENDKKVVYQYISEVFSNFSFSKHYNQFQEAEIVPDDFQKMYQELKDKKNFRRIFQLLRREEFCILNNIPVMVCKNVQILEKLGPRIINFIEFIKQQKMGGNIHELAFTKELLFIIINDEFNDKEKTVIEQIIGSCLTQEVYKFQTHIEMMKQENQKKYSLFLQTLQHKQLTGEWQNQDNLSEDSKFFVNLFTQNLEQSRINLVKQLKEYLKLKEDFQYSYENVIQELEKSFTQEFKFSQLYQMIIWHFLIQYSQVFLIIDEQKTVIQKLRLAQNLERKKNYINSVLQQSKQKNDEIFLYVMHRAIYFVDKIEDFISIEHFQTYQNKYLKIAVKSYEDLKVYTMGDLLKISEIEFFYYWQTVRQLSYMSLTRITLKDVILNKMLFILWLMEPHKQVQKDLLKILKFNQNPIRVIAFYIWFKFQQFSILLKTELLTVVSLIHKFDNLKLNLIKKIFNQGYGQKLFLLLKFDDVLHTKQISIKQTNWLAKIEISDWEVIKRIFENSQLIIFLNQIIVVNLLKFGKTWKLFYDLLRNLFTTIDIESDKRLQCFKIILSNVEPIFATLFIIVNKKNEVSLPNLKLKLFTLYSLYDKVEKNEKQKEIFWQNIEHFIHFEFCNIERIFALKNKNIELKLIHNIIKAYYFHSTKNYANLMSVCREIYDQDQELYMEEFSKQKYFKYFRATPWMLQKYRLSEVYPKNLKIELEAFNISLANMNEQQHTKLISAWTDNFKQELSFQKVIPLFFNIIKRGESANYFLSYLHQEMNRKYKMNLNLKAIFQILYNNSNEELQVMLLRFHSTRFPLPLIYQNPQFTAINNKEDFYILNHNLFYIFPNCFTIINFSFSKQNNRIGKTELINQIFYLDRKFETSDQSDITLSTIDIMFDFCFNGTRNFAIADTHCYIPLKILRKILPLFKLWIIQIDTLRELKVSVQKIEKLNIDLENSKIMIIIIVRNCKHPDEELIEIISNKRNLKLVFVADLSEKGFTDQDRKTEIENASKIIFSLIDQQNPLENVVTQLNFNQIIRDFSTQNERISDVQKQGLQIVNEIENELNLFLVKPDGFYCLSCFPLRGTEYKIKQAKQKLRNSSQNLSDAEKQNLKDQIWALEISLSKLELTRVLKLFYQLLSQSNYYILYLCLVDRLRQYNEIESTKYQRTIKQLNESISKMKNQLKKEFQSQSEKTIAELKDQLQGNIDKQQLKNIGVEIFWREIIKLNQFCQNKNQFINPQEKIFQMIKKGEPFEFLDGDQLQINSNFLLSLAESFPKKGNERVLVFSIIGPQSSGKSTILNKIFGCHFWTNVGRCTKGIYLQLLEVQNKELFNNQFDYILLLDTEGLQNPNQQDPEFDKKMVLFTLIISDIVLINVRGEINQQFKQLVEMSIHTLGHMDSSFSIAKQISWFFNQNNNNAQKDPFIKQLTEIETNLNKKEFIQTDERQSERYEKLLCIKEDNIFPLGVFASETNWKINTNLGVINDWRQMIFNESFSLEAYNNGIHIIKSLVEKVKQESNSDESSFKNLKFFIQNMLANWDSIQKLPDLLEFSELILYQQDLYMKDQFNQLYKEEYFDFTHSLIQTISTKVEQVKKKNINLFKQIQFEIEGQSDLEFEKVEKKLTDDINQIKIEKKIKKKIILKYQKRLCQNILSKNYEIKISILEKIKIHEIEYQTQEGFAQIEKFLHDLSSNPVELQRYQKDQTLITSQFEGLWEQIMNKLKEEKKKVFQEFQVHWLKAIQQTNTQYLYKTNYDQEYQELFQELNSTNPDWIDEKNKIFSIFKKELNENQFMLIDKSERKNIRYWDIFCQSADLKCKTEAEIDFLNISTLCNLEIHWSVVCKKELRDYLNNHFKKDMNKFIERCKKNNKQQDLDRFFDILDLFNITYINSHKLNLLQQIIKSNPLKNIFQNQVEKAFIQLKSSFNFNQQGLITLNDDNFFSQFNFLYPQLKVHTVRKQLYDENMVKLYKTELLKDYIIINSQQSLKYNEKSFLWDIQNPSEYNLNTKIIEQISEMMKNEGWEKLYSLVYKIIMAEFTKYASNSNGDLQSYCQNDENFIVSDSLVKSIIIKIEQAIIKFNQYFAKFGVLFRDIGERLIYYFSILIIWRFGCHKKWNQLEKSWKQEKDKANELSKFRAEILQNKVEQSKIKAKTLVDNIFQHFIDVFCKQKIRAAQSEVKVNEFSCANVVKYLDKIYLEESPHDIDLVVQYFKDQRKFIENFVQEELKRENKLLLEKYQKDFQQERTQMLEKILKNANLLKDAIYVQKKTKEYFNQNSEEQNFHERQLYKILIECLMGTKNFEISMIEESSQEIFQQDFQVIPFKIDWMNLQDTDQEVQQLSVFISEIIVQLEGKKNTVYLTSGSLQIQSKFDEKRLIMNGCQFTCPMCKRKCDLESGDHERHECKNGHFLRGMNGVLIDNKPSLFTCEEIEDDVEITTFETKNVKTWRQICEAYPEWRFKSLNDLEGNKEKMIKVWNQSVGVKLCEYFTKQFKTEVQFLIKHDYEKKASQTEPLHYIIILDDSGSMEGTKWENIRNGALQCMQDISKNPNAKVSVIIFNSNARVAIDCENFDYWSQEKKIMFQSGLTDYEKAFQAVFQQIDKHKNQNFSKIIMLMYTDGQANYPSKQITSFLQLPTEISQKITFIACTEEKEARILQKIIDALKEKFHRVELKKSIQTNAVTSIWTEIIRKNYHNLRC